MIPDEFYTLTYFALLTFIIIVSILPLLLKENLSTVPKINLVVGGFLILLLTIFFIGLRNPYGDWRYLGDTYNYTRKFLAMKYDPNWSSKKDLGFYVYMKLISKSFTVSTFYLISAVFYVVLPLFSFVKWFKEYSFFALVLYVSSMSFWGFGVNGLRNGLATSIFIFALFFYERKWIMYSLFFLAISFHKTIVLPMITLTIVMFYNNTKLLIKLWLFSIPFSLVFGRKIQSLLGVLLASSGDLIDDRAGNLAQADLSELVETTSSYRLDFIIYSASVVYLGYYFLFKKGFKSDFYEKIYNAYLIANTIWILLIYAPYTNRTAYLSWFLIPILIAYPIIKAKNLNDQSIFMLIALLANLFLTLLLAFK